MHKSRTISMLLAAFLSIGTGITAFSCLKGEDNTHLLKSPNRALIKRDGNGDFSNSDELANDKMTCYLTAATQTESSITVTAQFTIGSYTEWGDRNGSVYLVINDPDFSGDNSDPSLSGETNPTFTGYTSQIDPTSSRFADIFVIPEKMTYGSRFSVLNKTIKTGVLDLEGSNGSTVTKIVIPATVETIEAGAFTHIPDTIEIACVAASEPAGWEAGWTDAKNISFGFNDPNVLTTKNLVLATGTKTIPHPVEESYILGYINTPTSKFYSESFVEANLPLTVSYDVLEGETRKTLTSALPLLDVDSRNAPYDAVGDIGSASIAFTIDVFLEAGQTLDYESFVFNNVFRAVRDPQLNNYCCDTTEPFFKDSTKRFTNIIHLDDVLSCSFASIATFAGYSLVSMNVDKAKPYYYETVAASIIAENADKLASGAYRIRYAFYNFNSSSFRITYAKGGQEYVQTVNISTPLPVIEISKDSGNKISFILKDSVVGNGFSATSIKKFEILDLTIDMHLWNTDNNTKVGRTSRSVKFGIVEVMPYTNSSPAVTDLNLTLLIAYLIYIVVYAGITAGLFFYQKNKYKNDEFKRVKPKKFFKTAAIGFVGFAEILLAVIGLVYRTTVFRNTLSAFNPSDVLVVIAGIIALIIIGYFIKYIVGLVKAEKARKEIIKLKLNEIKE